MIIKFQSFALLSFLIFFFLTYGTSHIAQKTSKNILFVYGGWQGHEPEQCKDLFVPWLKSNGFNVIVTDSLNLYADSNFMSTIDLVIQVYTMSEISKEQEKGLLTAVKNGASIAGWHGGLGDAFRNNPDYQYMIGGQWVAHPGGIIDYEINILPTKDPITDGLNDFKINSEQYYMHIDPAIEILATTSFSDAHDKWIKGTVMPVVWKKKYGQGKVFYSSLGHSVNDFNVPEALTIMQRGILWALEEL